jgi:signal transduction histidine kinase
MAPQLSEEQQRLRSILRWFIAFSAPFVVAEIFAGALLPSRIFLMGFAIHSSVLVGLALAYRLAARAPLQTSALVAGYALLAGAAIGCIWVPAGTTVLLLVPLVSMALVLPFLSGPQLGAFAFVAWTAELVMAAARAPFFERRVPESKLVAAMEVGMIVAVAGIALLLLRQFSVRLRSNLARSEALERVARETADVLRLFAEAGARMGSSLDPTHDVDALAKIAVPRVADLLAVHLFHSDGAARVAIVAPSDSGAQVQQALAKPRSALFSRLMEARQAELHPVATDDLLASLAETPQGLETLRSLGISSVIFVPLVVHERRLGMATFIAAGSGRRFGDRELEVARELSNRTAQALENAKLYSDAREAVRVRDDFLSVASHELRTPLTALQLQLQSLLRPVKQPQPVDGTSRMSAKVDAAVQQVLRLERLVSNLLDVARISGRRLDLEPEPVDLKRLVEEVVKRLAPEIERAGCEVHVNAASVSGNWDPLRLDQVVTNLVSNAVRYGEGKPIDLTVKSQADSAIISVHDQGIGIAPEDQSRIFERFERAALPRHYHGMGLGLWIVREIVTAMGGEIVLESEAGKGATFTISMPLQ